VAYYSYTPGQGNAGTGNNFSFEWKDDFEVLDTSRWELSDFTGFGGNFCTFRADNVSVADGMLTLKMEAPQANTELVSVTFSVDVDAVSMQASDVVYLNGTFNNWCGSCMPMHKNGSVWELSIDLEPGRHQYLFTINGWDQVGNAPIGSACDYNPCDAYANYGFLIPAGSADIQLETVCWEQCPDCAILSAESTAPPEWRAYPNPFSQQLIVETELAQGQEFRIYSILGQQMLTGTLTADVHVIDVAAWPAGIYVLKTENQSLRLVKTE
jgi:hypothetical protein